MPPIQTIVASLVVLRKPTEVCLSPLSKNKGQLNEQVRYVVRGPRASAFFRRNGVTFDLMDTSTYHASTKMTKKREAHSGRFGGFPFIDTSNIDPPGVNTLLPCSDESI